MLRPDVGTSPLAPLTPIPPFESTISNVLYNIDKSFDTAYTSDPFELKTADGPIGNSVLSEPKTYLWILFICEYLSYGWRPITSLPDILIERNLNKSFKSGIPQFLAPDASSVFVIAKPNSQL